MFVIFIEQFRKEKSDFEFREKKLKSEVQALRIQVKKLIHEKRELKDEIKVLGKVNKITQS